MTDEQKRLVREFAGNLQSAVATNTACSEIIEAALLDADVRQRIAFKIDQKLSKVVFSKLLCPRCGFKAKNDKGIKAHIELGSCRKVPLLAGVIAR